MHIEVVMIMPPLLADRAPSLMCSSETFHPADDSELECRRVQNMLKKITKKFVKIGELSLQPTNKPANIIKKVT